MMNKEIEYWSSALNISKYFRVTILCHQQVVAKYWLTDDFLFLDIGGILTQLGVASEESLIFDSSLPQSV